MQSPTVRWGILGCGDVCEVKSGPGFQQAEGSELTAVMRRDRALAEDFARRHGVPAFYDDADRLIADPNVTAVYIATPPGNHMELALKVARAGKPAYIEKPMARTHSECLRMIAAFEQANVPLFVAYYRRALPRFLKAKEIIDGGRLGQLRTVDAHYFSAGQLNLDPARLPWRVQAEHAGGGLFLDLASHTLDVLDFWLGPLLAVNGHASNAGRTLDVEDRVSLEFATSSGARGRASWSFTNPTKEDSIRIEGSAGSLQLSTFGDGPLELETSAGCEQFTLPNPRTIQGPMIQTIVDSLRGRGRCLSTGVSAARTSEVMDRALAGYYGSRDEGFWKHPERWPGRRV
jgi:1,5-anhydro-D-fructose reductase (1,5-anhydro-D-mannitol-forming)